MKAKKTLDFPDELKELKHARLMYIKDLSEIVGPLYANATKTGGQRHWNNEEDGTIKGLVSQLLLSTDYYIMIIETHGLRLFLIKPFTVRTDCQAIVSFHAQRWLINFMNKGTTTDHNKLADRYLSRLQLTADLVFYKETYKTQLQQPLVELQRNNRSHPSAQINSVALSSTGGDQFRKYLHWTLCSYSCPTWIRFKLIWPDKTMVEPHIRLIQQIWLVTPDYQTFEVGIQKTNRGLSFFQYQAYYYYEPWNVAEHDRRVTWTCRFPKVKLNVEYELLIAVHKQRYACWIDKHLIFTRKEPLKPYRCDIGYEFHSHFTHKPRPDNYPLFLDLKAYQQKQLIGLYRGTEPFIRCNTCNASYSPWLG